MLRLELGILADAANHSEGKVNLLGEFSQILSATTPVVVPRFAVIVRVEGDSADVGAHKLRLSLLDPHGKSVELIVRDTQLVSVPGFPDIVRGAHVLGIEGALFFELGPHRIVVEVDGKPIGSIPFNVAPRVSD